jgi:hypothetical protein
MLTLEKNAKGQDISLRLRDRERMVSRSFLIALAIAGALHLFGALIFHIQPFRIGHEMKIFPPAVVDSDISFEQLDGGIVTDLEGNPKKQRYFLMPPLAKPALPEVPAPPRTILINETPFFADSSNPFLSIESENRPSPFTEKSIQFLTPLQINLAGGLTELDLITKLPPSIETDAAVNHYAARFNVRVNRGEIFWIRPEGEFGNTALKEEAKEVLENLRFKSDPRILSGIVEIILTKEAV